MTESVPRGGTAVPVSFDKGARGGERLYESVKENCVDRSGLRLCDRVNSACPGGRMDAVDTGTIRTRAVWEATITIAAAIRLISTKTGCVRTRQFRYHQEGAHHRENHPLQSQPQTVRVKSLRL